MLGTQHPYFERRGITEETAAKWNLGWHDKDDQVLFPVYMKEGKLNRLVGVIGRTVVDEGTKVQELPERLPRVPLLVRWLVSP